jgi:putative ABC transport system permease protein
LPTSVTPCASTAAPRPFAITAILTLALGIGATTAVFSVAYGVLIDPFPYRDVHALATPKLCMPDQPECIWRPYTPEQFSEIVEKTDIFSGITASTVGNVTTSTYVPSHTRCAAGQSPK